MEDDELRWDIEENEFHRLKIYYHAKNYYCHMAVEAIFNLMIIGFNVRELYLYRRNMRFRENKFRCKSIIRIFYDELLTENVKKYPVWKRWIEGAHGKGT